MLNTTDHCPPAVLQPPAAIQRWPTTQIRSWRKRKLFCASRHARVLKKSVPAPGTSRQAPGTRHQPGAQADGPLAQADWARARAVGPSTSPQSPPTALTAGRAIKGHGSTPAFRMQFGSLQIWILRFGWRTRAHTHTHRATRPLSCGCHASTPVSATYTSTFRPVRGGLYRPSSGNRI